MSVWFPRRSNGIYESVEYAGSEYLSPKKYIRKTEEECDALCNELNTLIQNEIFKASKIVSYTSKKFKIDPRFIIDIMKFQLRELGHEE